MLLSCCLLHVPLFNCVLEYLYSGLLFCGKLQLNFQAEVISPSEELLNNQVINDFDIEEDEIEIENR